MRTVWIVGLISITETVLLRLLAKPAFPGNRVAQALCAWTAYILMACEGIYILLETGSLVAVSVFLLGAELPVLAADTWRDGV